MNRRPSGTPDPITRLEQRPLIGHYERAGDVLIGDTTLDSPSDAERARRERMEHEG